MAPHSQAATGKRKKAHEPGKSLAVKSTNPASKKARKQKKQRPAAEQDKTNAAAAAAAAAADEPAGAGVLLSAALPPARQLEFLLRSFERAAKMRLSPLELGAYSEGCMVQLAEGASQDAESFGDHVKGAFGATWKGDLCEGKLVEGSVDAGSPALLVISLGALRSLELLRGLRMFTRGCHAVKLFAKHIKVEEQVALLKDRVNIACGTPSREVYFCIMVSLNKESHAETTAASAWSTVIGLLDSYLKYLVEHSNKWIKKLIDMEALSLSRLKLVVLDMQRDPKSFNLFTLPQVSNEFWDLFKGYLGEKVRGGNTRICFYGAVSEKDVNKVLPPAK